MHSLRQSEKALQGRDIDDQKPCEGRELLAVASEV